MARLTIKNFPDSLYRILQERAKQEHRSLPQQVIHILHEATNQEPVSLLELRGLGKDWKASHDTSEGS